VSSHFWVRADRAADRERLLAELRLPPVLAVVDAHRRLRGPYTAAGTVLRLIGPDALRRRPELGPRHHVVIQQTTPELRVAVPDMGFDIASMVEHQTRFLARIHTLRLSHGLCDFIQGYLAALEEPRTLVVSNLQHADPTDLEFMAVLLRRMDPARLTVVACTGAGEVADPPGPIPVSIGAALAAYATPVAAAAPDSGDTGEPEPDLDGAEVAELARRFVVSDGISDDQWLVAAYHRLPPAQRAALHDERAAALTALGEPSLLLGAVPYHAEHGSDPAGAGARAVRQAQQQCRLFGFYHAAAELGLRGRRLVDRDTDWERWWKFTSDTIVCLSSAGRADETAALIEEVRQLSQSPTIQMHLAYETAMLYARHYDDAKRDFGLARGWLNLAISISTVLDDSRERTYHTVFNRNGLALVEVRQGRFDEAIRLVTEGMERMDRELEPGDFHQHRIGLRYNRAQVYVMVGRYEEALSELSAVMEVDEFFPDHYFNRGNVLRKLGRTADAVVDYTRALEISPPFHEAYYNRAACLVELGDLDGALADYGRVVELDPDNADARLNKASVLRELGDPEAALREVAGGLDVRPDHAHLLALRGQLLADLGQEEAARAALLAAVGNDPSLAEAWAVLGELQFEAGALDVAAEAFDRAVELGGTPEMRFNRAVVHQAAGRFAAALADYDAVLAVIDDPDARSGRDECLRAAGQPTLAMQRR